MDLPAKPGSALKADLQLSWDRELLNNNVMQQASFVGYQNAGFGSTNELGGRNALGLQAGLTYNIDKDVAIGAQLASDLLRPGYDSLAGNLNATWRF